MNGAGRNEAAVVPAGAVCRDAHGGGSTVKGAVSCCNFRPCNHSFSQAMRSFEPATVSWFPCHPLLPTLLFCGSVAAFPVRGRWCAAYIESRAPVCVSSTGSSRHARAEGLSKRCKKRQQCSAEEWVGSMEKKVGAPATANARHHREGQGGVS